MKQQQRTGAFTLVELLVVMAIIGILAGLMIPVLGSARASARDTQCLGNLRNIGTAMMMYIGVYDDHIPPAGQSEDVFYLPWYYSLLPYNDDWGIYECPSKGVTIEDIPELTEDLKTVAGRPYHAVNYGMNFQFPGILPSEDLMGGTIQTTMLISVSEVLIIADGAHFAGSTPASEFKGDNELPGSVMYGGLYFSSTIQEGQPTVSPRHRERTMCLFLDGSAKYVLTKDILAIERDQPGCVYDAALHQF